MRTKKTGGVCDAPKCNNPVQVVKWCQAHYARQWQGMPMDTEVYRRMTEELQQQIIEDIKAGMTLIEGEQKYGYNRSNLSRTFNKREGISIREWKKQNNV